ncbi:interleukin-12 subunit alpha-like protein [Lates japonicus]|uniref:Interleukin-12 subunit alpha n=1 Tax=Lates japonicus TaxID=270547 RepID=A0AAD3MFP9_LATJO|nr:interleukin-12 subunit alpha-like protein [Lates japonicus]
MANFNFYFVSCLLLLTLSWRTSTGVPLPAPNAEKCAQCSEHFKTLLLNIKDLLNNDTFWYGARSDKVVIGSTAETSLACAPTLTQSECLRNIMKDLAFYEAAIKSYIKSPLRSPQEEVPPLEQTLEIIGSLKKCSLKLNGESNTSEEDVTQMWGTDTFNNRQEMHKIMRGFYVRTITINRAMGYISSGDHRK